MTFLTIKSKVPTFTFISFRRPTTLLKRDSNTGVFEICKIFKNTFFHRTLPVAASPSVKFGSNQYRNSQKYDGFWRFYMEI